MNSITLTAGLKLLGGLFVLFALSGIISHLLGVDKYNGSISEENASDDDPDEEDPGI